MIIGARYSIFFVMRILFVKLGSIGDVVHTLPALAAVRRAITDSEVEWVVENKSAEILRNNPAITRLIEIDTKSLRRKNVLGKTIETAKTQLRDLRASEFDLAIDFQGLLKSASITKLAKTRRTYGFSKRNLREPASRALLNKSIDVEPNQNIVLKNIELAEKSLADFLCKPELKLDREKLEFPISTDQRHKQEAQSIIEQTGGRFAILNPAGGWVTKLWHAEKYGKLADLIWEKLGISSVITTAPNEVDLAKKALADSVSGKAFLAQASLRGFYELAKKAQIYIGGDTGPTHLAVAANCPVIGIFGPTEWWRNGSVNAADICVERNEIDCRIDCHRRTCNKWICMDIPVETVFEAIEKRLNK